MYHISTLTRKLLCPAKDSSLLGLLQLHPQELLVPASSPCGSTSWRNDMWIPFTAWWHHFSRMSLRLVPPNEFLNKQQFGSVYLVLLNYPALSLMHNSSTSSSFCVLPSPDFTFPYHSPMVKSSELHASSDSTQMLWPVLIHTNESF